MRMDRRFRLGETTRPILKHSLTSNRPGAPHCCGSTRHIPLNQMIADVFRREVDRSGFDRFAFLTAQTCPRVRWTGLRDRLLTFAKYGDRQLCPRGAKTAPWDRLPCHHILRGSIIRQTTSSGREQDGDSPAMFHFAEESAPGMRSTWTSWWRTLSRTVFTRSSPSR